MVTKDTVDADIYEMQERKSKMNAAIMETSSEKAEKNEMLKIAMNRYLGKAEGNESLEKKVQNDSSNKENDVICLI